MCHVRNHLILMRHAIAMLVVTAAGAATASGYPVTFEFGGTITEIIDNGSVLPGLVEVGDTFSGSFTFDSELVDLYPDDPVYGEYQFSALGAMQLNVGTLSLTSGSEHLVRVKNGPTYDKLGLGAFDFISGDISVDGLGLGFRDDNGTLYSDDSLTLIPPSLSEIEETSFQIEGHTTQNGQIVLPGFAINGVVEYLIPEPSCVLFGLLGILCWLRRAAWS